jgi:hypothetical protein
VTDTPITKSRVDAWVFNAVAPQPNRVPEIHEAIRQERIAAAAVDHWGKQYKANPTDENAMQYHAAWCSLRAYVNDLVRIESPIMERVSLAAYGASATGPEDK